LTFSKNYDLKLKLKLAMKKTLKKFKFLPIIYWSFWLLIFPAYLYYSTLDDLDVASPHKCFKKIDQEDSILSSEKKEKILGLIFFIKHVFKTTFFLERVPSFSLQLLPLNSRSLILRC